MRETAWVTLGVVGGAFLQIFAVRVYAHGLSQENFGIYVLAQTIAAFAMLLAYGPLAACSVAFLSDTAKCKNHGIYRMRLSLISTAVMLSIPISAIVFMLAYVSIGNIGQIKHSLLLATGMSGLAVSSGILAMMESFRIASRERAGLAVTQLIGNACKPTLVLLLFTLLGTDLSVCSVILAQTIVNTLSIAIHVNKLISLSDIKNLAEPIDPTFPKKVLSYSLPFSVWAIPQWLQTSADRFSIERFVGLQQLGSYGIVWQVSYVPIVLANSIAEQLLTPIIFDSAKWKEPRRIFLRILAAIGVLGACCIGLYLILLLIGSSLISFLAPGYIIETATMMTLPIAAYLFSISQLLTLPVMHLSGPKSLRSAKLCAALFGVLIVPSFVWQWGSKGAAIALVIHSMIALCLNFRQLITSFKSIRP